MALRLTQGPHTVNHNYLNMPSVLETAEDIGIGVGVVLGAAVLAPEAAVTGALIGFIDGGAMAAGEFAGELGLSSSSTTAFKLASASSRYATVGMVGRGASQLVSHEPDRPGFRGLGMGDDHKRIKENSGFGVPYSKDDVVMLPLPPGTPQNKRIRPNQDGNSNMPARRYSKKRGGYTLKSKHRRRSRYTQKPIARALQGNTFIPKQRRFSHTGYGSTALNCGALSTNDGNAVVANGIYKPYLLFDNSASAPLFTDQMGAQYDKVVVNKATLRVDFFVNHGTDADGGGVVFGAPQGAICGVAVSNDDTIKTTRGWYEERPDTTWTTVGTHGHATIVKSIDPRSYLGISDPKETILQGSESANPTNGVWFHVYARDINVLNAAWEPAKDEKVIVNSTCIWECTWFEPKGTFAQSTL